MLQKRVLIPSAGGYELPLDLYIPHASPEIDVNVRRSAIVICPGGGYVFRSEREAEPIALRFMALGFNTIIVNYRVAPDRYPLPQQDLAAAVAYVRTHCEELHTNPDQIAVMGFSAGGHLACSLGVWWQRAELWEELGLTPEEVKPNAMVLCYPVISAGEFAHRGSFDNLTGTQDRSVQESCSLENHVTPLCPPTFLWHTFEDRAVPVENSLMLAAALSKAHVVTEMHVFPFGSHGSSLCNEQTAGVRNPHMDLPDNAFWPELAAKFLKKVMK